MYRKILSKSIKKKGVSSQIFTEKLDRVRNPTKFYSQLTKASLNATINREKRQYKDEVK